MMRMAAMTSSCYSLRRSRRGTPCCLPIISYVRNCIALYHSQPLKPFRCEKRHFGRNVEDASKVFDEMLHRRPLPSVVVFTQIMTQFSKLKHYSSVIVMSKRMEHSGIVRDVFTLSIIMNCYCQLSQMGFGLSVFGKFFKLGIDPTVATFNTLINGFLVQKKVAEATSLFRKMVEVSKCKPNVITYGTVIKGHCMMGDNNAAIRELRMMEERGCKPDIVVYNTIIDSLCKDALVGDALNLFSEMISKGIFPDVIAYTSLIDGFCRKGNWKEATRLLDEMVSYNILPDVRTFSVLVDSLCKEGKVVEAKSLVDTMIQRNIEPDVVTYNSLMDGYCLLGEMDEAKLVFDLILSKRSMVDVYSCNILINGFCKQKKIAEANKVLQEMPRLGLVPNAFTFNSLLDGCFKVGRLQDAHRLLYEMQECGQHPDILTYSTLVHGLCSNGQFSEVMELLKEMEDNKMEAYIAMKQNALDSALLIETYAKCGNVEKALEVFHSVERRDVFVWNAMICALATHGQGRDALQFFSKMLKAKVNPDAVTFINILCACSYTGLVEEGRIFFKQMERVYGVVPDTKHYTSMVDILCRSGNLDEAAELVEKMPISSTPAVWEVLLGACNTHGNVELAEKACSHLLSLDPKNRGAYVLLSNLYAKTGNWEATSELRKLMRDSGIQKEPGCSSIEVDSSI